MQTRSRGRLGAVVLGMALAMLGADAGAGVHIKRTLHSTGVDPDARGQALVSFSHHGGHAKLAVKGRKLAESATFAVTLGGVRIGTLTTNHGGNGQAKFASAPGHHDQLLGVDPRGKRLAVEDEAGEDVLDDDIPAGSTDPSTIACCRSEEDGTECGVRTPADCARKHGTATTATSCMPDPCGSTQVRCCKPDDDGPECETTTPAGCNEHHGVDLGAGACDPNPCTNVAPDVVRCCVQDGGEMHGDHHGRGHDDRPEGPECEHLTAAHCAAEGGKALDAGSCDPNPCSPSGAFIDADAGTAF